MCERKEPFQTQVRNDNNNRDGGLADANANNELPREEDTKTVDFGNLSQQEKDIMWGIDSQCDDPELIEFERLESLELDTLLLGEGEDFVGLADGKDRGKSAVAEEENAVKESECQVNNNKAEKDPEANRNPCKTSSRGTRLLPLDPRVAKPQINSANREGRKPWMSPGRQLARTSLRTSSSSPSRQPPASPAKVPGARAVSLERSNTPQRGRPLRPLTRSASSLTKPTLEPEPSPPQIPKSVRPKIITCIRKNPNVSETTPAAGTVGASPNLQRRYSYASPRMKPPSGAGSQRMGVKSNSFHRDTGERNPQQLGSGGAVTRQPASTQYQDHAGETGPDGTPKRIPLKPGHSGLRPPGFSSLPARLTQSSSASPSSSNQSKDRDRGQLSHATRRDVQRESVTPAKSSSKRMVGISPKPSPVRGRSAEQDGTQDLDRALVQQLRESCEQQSLQLQILQEEFKKASRSRDVFSINTQHCCHMSAVVKERELSLELAKIRDELAVSVANWEQLQQEKQQQKSRFEAELQGLQAKQRVELRALEEQLSVRHMEENESLQAQHQCELEELRFKQQELVEHAVSLVEMTHADTLATLHEEHARTVKNLKMAHEQQTKSLEEEFEKIRLSLQDQVDTLTFQNRSLRDRAERFEEALRRSSDEQIVEALAPYKHIEEDLKSLKEVLEMKNKQIHEQDQKITELEKIAEKNVYLKERLQVMEQQNEDLKERIDKNVAVSRQLSEENANLQVNVEKESNEKKRLSRTNEELLWRLQTGELSPRMSPSSSPLHRPASGPGSPARPHSYHQ